MVLIKDIWDLRAELGPFQGFSPNWEKVPNLGPHYEHWICQAEKVKGTQQTVSERQADSFKVAFPGDSLGINKYPCSKGIEPPGLLDQECFLFKSAAFRITFGNFREGDSRSQSLLYFVPQEKNITVNPTRLGGGHSSKLSLYVKHHFLILVKKGHLSSFQTYVSNFINLDKKYAFWAKWYVYFNRNA